MLCHNGLAPAMQARQTAQLRRCFAPSPLSKGQLCELPSEAVRHLRSLRLQVGDAVEVVNGRGELATGQLSAIGKRSASVRACNASMHDPAAVLGAMDCIAADCHHGHRVTLSSPTPLDCQYAMHSASSLSAPRPSVADSITVLCSTSVNELCMHQLKHSWHPRQGN